MIFLCPTYFAILFFFCFSQSHSYLLVFLFPASRNQGDRIPIITPGHIHKYLNLTMYSRQLFNNVTKTIQLFDYARMG
jgi:hypothetical protein